jgi:hypothetical protein
MYILQQHVTETAGMLCTVYGTEGLRIPQVLALGLWLWRFENNALGHLDIKESNRRLRKL